MPPTPTPSHLVAKIAQLQNEFQRLADGYDWICYYAPRPGSQDMLPLVGENSVATGYLFVRVPMDAARRTVTNHVDRLTNQADGLLRSVLKYDSRIPTTIQEEIREEGRRGFEYGWLRWLRFVVPCQFVDGYKHYPQVAATALCALKENCLLDEELASVEVPKWLTLLAAKILDKLASLPAGEQHETQTSVSWRWSIEYLWDEARLIPVPEGRVLPNSPNFSTIAEVRLALGILLDWVNVGIDRASAEQAPTKFLPHPVREESAAQPAEPKPQNSIRLVGEVWHLLFGIEKVDCPKQGNQSLEWLAKLLSTPNRFLSIADLRGDPDGKLAGDAALNGEQITDPEGVSFIKKRLGEIEDLAEETGGSETLDNEKAELLRQLRTADDEKQFTNPLRKAHHNIATQIRSLRSKWSKDAPNLFQHLKLALRLEFPHFSYRPPAGTPIWQV